MKTDNVGIRVTSWVLCVIAGIVLVWTAVGIYLFGGKLEIILKDLGVAVPMLSQALIASSRLGLWLVLPTIAAIQIGLECKFNGSRNRISVNAAYLLLALIVMALSVVGAFAPFLYIIESTGAQSGP